MKVVHFGAGNIGRGFIGVLLKHSNYELVFVDVNDDLISKLQADGEYTVKYLAKDKADEVVTGVKALNSKYQLDEVIAEIASADLVTTSLGQENLKFVTNTIYQGIEQRAINNETKCIDVVACENGIKVSSILKEQVENLYDDQYAQYLNEHVGYVDCTVDRIVPNQVNDNICDVQVEEAFEWVLDKNQVKANFDIKEAKYAEELGYYNKRKLLTVNLTHSLIGYIGWKEGYEYVHQALSDEQIQEIVKNALNDIQQSLVCEFDIDPKEQAEYSQKTIKRFANDLIVDEVGRVARNPKIKLGYDERYVSPLRMLVTNARGYGGIGTAIAYALSYRNEEEEQALEIGKMIDDLGVEPAIKKITGVNDELIVKYIGQQYRALNN